MSNRLLFIALAATLACAAPLSAQQTADEQNTGAAGAAVGAAPVNTAPVPEAKPVSLVAARPTTPALTLTYASAEANATARTIATPVELQSQRMGSSVALMVVGGAAIVVGSIIGGDTGTIFMVGGAVVGLYGLYQYLR